MSIEKLAQFGWYKAKPSSPKEIADLFSIVNRSQADAKVESISDDLRFQAAYNGILTLVNIALRASGFRVSIGQGHHQRRRVIQREKSGCARSNLTRRRGTPRAMTWPVVFRPPISRKS